MQWLLGDVSQLAAQRLFMGVSSGIFLLLAVLVRERHKPREARELFSFDFLLYASLGNVMVYGLTDFATERIFRVTPEMAETIGLAVMGLALGAFAAYWDRGKDNI